MTTKIKLSCIVNLPRPGFTFDDVAQNIAASFGLLRPRSCTVHVMGANKKGRARIASTLKRKGITAKVKRADPDLSVIGLHHALRLSTSNEIHVVLEGHERIKCDPSGIVERYDGGGYGEALALGCPMVALTGVHGTQYRRTDNSWGIANVCRIWLPGDHSGEVLNTADMIGGWFDEWIQVSGAIVSDGWRPELAHALKASTSKPHGARVIDLPLTGKVESEPITAARAIVVVCDHELDDDDPIRAVASNVVVIDADAISERGWSAALVSDTIPFMSAYRNALIVPVQRALWTRARAKQVALAVTRAALSANPYACVWKGADDWPAFWALTSLVIPVGFARTSMDGAIAKLADQFKLNPTQIEIQAVGVGVAESTDPEVADLLFESFKMYPFDGLSAIGGAASTQAREHLEALDAALWGAFCARWWCPSTLAKIAAYTDAGALSDVEVNTLGKAWLSAMLQSDKVAPFWDVAKAANMIANPGARGGAIIDAGVSGGNQADQERPDQGSSEAPSESEA